ncbi:hypothetical protein [Myceligenerans crystallogenes]|uniref:Uncharacterized protein n=1 Tax=Myceligenerans crystallogenes TaxID=316335 RepID=A0ABN2NA72_9MICO
MFEVSRQFKCLKGQLVYSRRDRGFDFFPDGDFDQGVLGSQEGTTSLAGSAIQIEVSVGDGRILYPWGYCPQVSWETSTVRLPQAQAGAVLDKSLIGELVPGVSIRLVPDLARVKYDPTAGVVWIASGVATRDVVTIADGVCIGLADGAVSDLWLVPEFRD